MSRGNFRVAYWFLSIFDQCLYQHWVASNDLEDAWGFIAPQPERSLTHAKCSGALIIIITKVFKGCLKVRKLHITPLNR